MTRQEKKYPSCFGVLETVFPKREDGLRSTPTGCLGCMNKTLCLRSAMTGVDGLKVREEFIDRAYASGRITFWERWSGKKEIERRIRKGIKPANNLKDNG